VNALLLLAAGATIASLGFVASGWGGAAAARGFTACTDGRGYLYVRSTGTCPPGAAVSWTGEIPAVAQGAKSLTKSAVVQVNSFQTVGVAIKDPDGKTRTKSYVAKCPLEYVAVGGAFDIPWARIYDVDIATSRPRMLQGVSAWEVLVADDARTNRAPIWSVNVSAICIARTAIFPSG
jgi:hypothetical protein